IRRRSNVYGCKYGSTRCFATTSAADSCSSTARSVYKNVQIYSCQDSHWSYHFSSSGSVLLCRGHFPTRPYIGNKSCSADFWPIISWRGYLYDLQCYTGSESADLSISAGNGHRQRKASAGVPLEPGRRSLAEYHP